MNSIEPYDAIIIGSGQGGGPLARSMATAGWKTAVVERIHVGGTCINEGCTPTKTMVASGKIAYLARRSRDYGVGTGSVSVDLVQVRKRKRAMVDSWRDSNEQRLRGTQGLSLLKGEARFVGPKSFEVRLQDGSLRFLQSETVVLNVGMRPAQLALPGLEEIPALDSTSIMELDQLPEHLMVVGGGYVGLEFGQMFHRFGSRVTIVQRGHQLLSREDPDVAEEIMKLLQEDGLDVMLDTIPLGVEGLGDREIRLTVRGPKGETSLKGSHLLIAAGRTPNTDSLNAAASGLEVDSRGFIRVNETLETKVPGIFAIGDVKGGPAFTHISYDDYRILRKNILEGGHATVRNRMVPYTVYIDPQLGRVGMTESEARAAGRNIRVAKMPMNYVARAVEVDESRGFMKAVVDADTSQVIGCAILGVEGGELMTMLQIAMMGQIPYQTLREATFAHPTLAESLNNLFASFQD
jgi:pyruvate/2-oxoglutarate dehydrogenase complex dihydrolipoamide dehydrogenase (E3) component